MASNFLGCYLPAVGRAVAAIQPLALGAGGDHHHGLGDVGVVAADGLPGVLQGRDQTAGHPVRGGGGGGWLVIRDLALLL